MEWNICKVIGMSRADSHLLNHFQAYLLLGFRLPISHPHLRSVFTTFGSIAAVTGTLMKMKLL